MSAAVVTSNSVYEATLKIVVPYKWQAVVLKDVVSLPSFFQALEGLIVEHISGVLEHTTRYNIQSGGEKGPYVFQMHFKGTLGGFATLSHIPGFIEGINIINPYSANYIMALSEVHYINIGHEYGKKPHSLPPKELAVGKPATVCPSAPARVVSEKVEQELCSSTLNIDNVNVKKRSALLEPEPRMPTVMVATPLPSGARSPAVVQESIMPSPSQGSDIASLQSSIQSLELDTIKSRSKVRYRSLLSQLASLQQETYLLEEHRKEMLKKINDNKKRMHVFEFAMDEIIDLMGGPEFMRE